MPIDPPPQFSAEHAAFMQRGVSISVASCGAGRRPSVARALGCTISDDRRTVRVLVSRAQAAPVLAHVRASAALAVVFSEPSTHRTLQLKGRDAALTAIGHADLDVVARYRDSFVRELAPLGYDGALIRALVGCPDAELVALSFTPYAAFSQTPGPTAGQTLQVPA